MRSEYAKSGIAGIMACFMAAQSSFASPLAEPPAPKQSESLISFDDARILAPNLCAFDGFVEPGGKFTAVVAIKDTRINLEYPTKGAMVDGVGGNEADITITIKKQLQRHDTLIAFHEEAFVASYKEGMPAGVPMRVKLLDKSALGALTRKHQPLLDAMPQIAKSMFDYCVTEFKKQLKEKRQPHKNDNGPREFVQLLQTQPKLFSFSPPSSARALLL